jgi:hypothetical protein
MCPQIPLDGLEASTNQQLLATSCRGDSS